MKKAIILFLGIILACSNMYSQTIKWQKSIGGTSDDNFVEVHQTADSGFIMIGSTYSNNYDVSGNHGSYDYYVVKTNSAGEIEWKKCFGGSGADFGKSVKQTTDGGYILSGSSISNDYDVSGNNGNYDYWVVKIDSIGNIEWQKSLGGSQSDQSSSIQQTTDGGYIVGGRSSSNDSIITDHHGSITTRDFWVVKLTSTGTVSWNKSYGGTSHEDFEKLEKTSDGGYVLSGQTNSNNYDVSGNHGGYDYWVVKINSTGTIMWKYSLGGSNNDRGFSVQETDDGKYILAGSSFSTDGNISNHVGGYSADYWVIKIDTLGNKIWDKSLGGNADEADILINKTNNGGFIIAGYSFSDDGDITDHHGTTTYCDYWIVKLDSSTTSNPPNVEWKKSLGGILYDYAYSVEQIIDGSYIIAGYSYSSSTVGTDTSDVTGHHGSTNYSDGWLVKLCINSTAATAATATNDTICAGSSTTLGITSGTLGSGASWYWYSAGCGTTYIASTSTGSVTVSPTVTTTYYARAEGVCNTTTCVSVIVTVNDTSVAASSALASSPVYPGTTTTLSITGGSLGAGANWNWYSAGCGTTFIASGNSIVETTTIAITYWVRAEGTCNTTNCVSVYYDAEYKYAGIATIGNVTTCFDTTTAYDTITVPVWLNNSPPISALGLRIEYDGDVLEFLSVDSTNTGLDTIGNNPITGNETKTSNLIKLILYWSGNDTISGNGKLCNIRFKYYGGYSAITFNNSANGGQDCETANANVIALIDSPTSTYYINGSVSTGLYLGAISGNQNPYTDSTEVYSVTANPDVISYSWTIPSGWTGTSTTNSITVVVGSIGGNITVTPTDSCGIGLSSVLIINKSYLNIVVASPVAICDSGSTTLSITSGNLSGNDSWNWYTGSCGGALVGSTTSSSFIIPTITVTTTYYVRAETNTNGIASVCKSVTVIVGNISSTSATSFNMVSSTICQGTDTLSFTGGTLGSGAVWAWYYGSCGGYYVGSVDKFDTTNYHIFDPTIPTATYYVRAEGICNTTTCISIDITNNFSTTPSIIVSSYNLCPGITTTLYLSHLTSPYSSTLGSNAMWNWYTGACGTENGGTYITSGASPIVSPTINTSYYVRGEGTCNTTICNSVTMYVVTNPTSITTSQNPSCSGFPVILTQYGGILPTGIWQWYEGSCGGYLDFYNYGNNSTIIVYPTVTTTYYVNANGCLGNCVGITITVLDTSVAASSASASPSAICAGDTTTLSLIGGHLGYGGNWYWYSGSCGNGAPIGTGATIIQTPSVTTTYYVRAIDQCDITTCVSVTVTANSIMPSSISANTFALCAGMGQSSTLETTGGILGTGANWYWYDSSCGVGLIGTGETIILSPTITTTYYLQAMGTCDTTSCLSATITVGSSTSTPATSVIATIDTICQLSSNIIDTLIVSGGALGTGASWFVYSSNCGGIYITSTSSDSIIVSPTVSTIYWVRAEGACDTTSCVSVTVINNNSIPTNIHIVSIGCCPNSYTQLGIISGTLGASANWMWYEGGCGSANGGTYLNSGNTTSQYPLITTNYYVRAEGACNTTICDSVTIELCAPATNIIASADTICHGSTTTLTKVGGSISSTCTSVVYWNWYSNATGYNIIGIGDSIVVRPDSTTTYSLRPDNCTYADTSITIYVNTPSLGADFAIANPDTVCQGSSTTILLSGGDLGIGAIWNWYSGSCGGGSIIGTGIETVQSPTNNTTYYVRAANVCNTTTCISVTVYTDTLSIQPAFATGTPNAICPDSTSILTLTGGLLGTDAAWYWYEGSCLGTFVASGATTSVTPTVTTTYYVRAEGICNKTNCASVTVYVGALSDTASYALASPSLICNGSSTTLSEVGGNLGTNANWYWYTGSCGGTLFGSTTTNIIVSPTDTTTYWVRAEGTCVTTSCVSVTVFVIPYTALFIDTSNIATANPDTICVGSATTLSVTGTLGAGVFWHWYIGTSCTGTSIGTGATIIQNPTATTSYFVRKESPCDTSDCIDPTVYVNSLSDSASSISASDNPICSGDIDTLYVNGGTLGSGANWYWYIGSCGGTFVGTGYNITQSPTITTTYYVRAEGICNTTSCVKRTIRVHTTNTIPTSITATSPVCIGNATSLTITGGTLGVGGVIKWYSGSCGGTYINSGITPTIAATDTFYIRIENDCNTTTCLSVIVVVDTLSVSATAITASDDTICVGNNDTLNITGGTLGTGAAWFWSEGSCGGAYVGSGATTSVSPTITTTYYVRAEGTCNSTTCVSATITVNNIPSQSAAIIGDTLPTTGDTLTYSTTSVAGVTYTWTAPSGWVGSSTSASITYIVGSITNGVITVVPNNSCGAGIGSAIVLGNICYQLSGNFTYDNTAQTPLDSLWVFLMQNGAKVDSIQADLSGYYHFCVPNGVYNVTATTHKAWGGVNVTDAVKVKRHYGYLDTLKSSIKLHAADVNGSVVINITDKVKICSRFAGSDTVFKDINNGNAIRADWIFEKPIGGDTLYPSSQDPNIWKTVFNDTIIINNSNVVQPMKGLCLGDVNGSYTPGTGAKGIKVKLISNNIIKLNSNEYYDLPLIIKDSLKASAISLILNFPKNMISIEDVKIVKNGIIYNINTDTNLIFNVNKNELRIGWNMDTLPLQTQKGDTLFYIRIKTTNSFKQGDNIGFDISNNILNEFADENIVPISDVTLNTSKIKYDNSNKEQQWNNGQNAPITTISTITPCYNPNDTITFNVTAINLDTIAGFGFDLYYNGSVLSYIQQNPNNLIGNFHNTNPAMYNDGGDITTIQTNYNNISGYKFVRCYWSTFSIGIGVIPIFVNNVAQLYDLSFRYYGGNTNITFNNSGGGGQLCEWTDVIGDPYRDTPTVNFYINGMVTQCEDSSIGINNINKSRSDLLITPNPAKETIYIRTKEKGYIYIYNVLGEMVLYRKCEKGENTINVEHLAEGSYIVKFVGLKSVIAKKIIINRN